MFTVSRFTRLLLLAVLLVTIPAAVIFYPSSDTEIESPYVDAGGIDSPHWRDPVAPTAEGGFGHKVVFEDEEQRAVEAPVAQEKEVDPKEQWAADTSEPGSEHAQQLSGGKPPGQEDGDVPNSGGVMPEKEGEVVTPGSGGVKPSETERWLDTLASPDVHGATVMPEMGNATAKAELGRGTWRLLHLITMRFPDKPTDDERAALKAFFYMFARLYPCGDCAKHFQAMLKDYPPQTASRQNASLWLCTLHNMVNERLGKPEFDCSKLDETWDCGCGNSTTVAGMAETGKAKL